MKPLLAAIQFLTIVPVPWTFDERAQRHAVWYFPLVGLLLGGTLAGLDAVLLSVFPVTVTTVLVLVAALAISGALHLDGLADSADAFFSCRPRDRMLEIMRDSRSGPMGVCAVVIVMLLKYTALACLAGDCRRDVLVLMPIAGRSAMVLTMRVLNYARPKGLATPFRASAAHAWAATLFLLGVGWAVASMRGVLCAGLSLTTCLLLALYSYRKVGGYTGDTLGATCELVETATLLVWVAGLSGRQAL